MSRKTKQRTLSDENPEWSRTDFAQALRFPAGVRLKDLKPDELAKMFEAARSQKGATE